MRKTPRQHRAIKSALLLVCIAHGGTVWAATTTTFTGTRVWVTDAANTIYALDRATGNPLWKHQTDPSAPFPMTGVPDHELRDAVAIERFSGVRRSSVVARTP
jgi:hypothetical protein